MIMSNTRLRFKYIFGMIKFALGIIWLRFRFFIRKKFKI